MYKYTHGGRLLIAIGVILWNGTGVSAQQTGSVAKSVGVITLQAQDVTQNVDLPGRAVAFEQVDVRPRVDGVVKQIIYTPGETVKVGDPLFQLDDAQYVATVAADKATLVQAQADLPVKQAAYDRAVKLQNQGYTQAEVESAQYDLASAKATLDSAEAALIYAQTQLSWTTIRSPINGIPEVQEVSVGDLVSAAQDDALTTVTRLDPVYVDMLEPSTHILQIRRQIDKGELSPNRSLAAELVLEDGETYTGSGKIVTPSAIVSTSTGTVSLRFEFQNPDLKIRPGMFVHGTVTIGTTKAWLVPQRTTTISTTGNLTAFVVQQGKAKLVNLTYSGTHNDNWIVTAGVSDGDALIVDGLKNLSDGAEVKTVPVAIDDDGITHAETPTGSTGE